MQAELTGEGQLRPDQIVSIAYIELLDDVMKSGLRFPAEFVGLSDIGRGGLLLRRPIRDASSRM
jgi:hypothetical protein